MSTQIQQRQLVETLFEHPALSIVRLALHWNKKLKIQHTASQWLKKRMNVPPSHYPLFAEAMRHSNKWEFLHFLLATGASPDILFSWLSAFNRKAQQPTQKQKQAIEKHWSKRIPHAPKDLKQVLSQSGIKLT